MHLLPHALSSLLLLSSVPAALAVSLNDFQPILGFPLPCMEVYTSTIPGCQLQDFAGGNPCSSDCLKGVQSTSNDLNNACVGVRVTPTTLIGLFFQGQGIVALCPNFDPPPPNGGDGAQTNNNPPDTKATSIEEPPTLITTTSTTSQDTTKTLPPQVTETTTRWEISSLQITIFGTGTEGTVTADPTDPPTQTASTSSTSVDASSPENDINNIAGTGNSAGSRLDIPFENSLAQGLPAIVCIAIVL